jgi:hypothetical protein
MFLTRPIMVLTLLLSTHTALYAQETTLGFVPFGDARVRYEHTQDIPGRTDAIERVRARAHLGALYLGVAGWEFGGAALLNAGTDQARDNRRNKDNEYTDRISLDQLYGRWQGETLNVQFGKAALPFALTPLVWDADLRPIGLSTSATMLDDAGTGFALDAGYFAPDFVFDNEKPRLAAVQAGWHWQRGQPISASALLSYLRFSRLEGLPGNGIGRTNRRLGANYLSDYELLDIQLIGRVTLGDKPLTIVLDGVDNRGADTLNKAGRASVAWGNMREGGFEFGVAYQRNARDSVLSIAADDEWWFQSFSRGTMPWLGYGFSENTFVRAAAFDERRDGITKSTRRVLFDLATQW